MNPRTPLTQRGNPTRPQTAGRRASIPAWILAAVCLAGANDRRFTYTYETATMPKAAKEIEVWTTARLGRDKYYARLDHRLEFETGITDKLQAAFYLNWYEINGDDGTGGLISSNAWDGISTEFKYQFTGPASHPLGFALYGEAGYNTQALELEAKALFDKWVDPMLFALNLVAEAELEAERSEMELEEWEFEVDMAAGLSLSPAFWLGLELRNHTEFAKEPGSDGMAFEHSALFLGPALSYSGGTWWMAFTLLPQIPGFKVTGDGPTELQEHENVEARLLFSFHI